MEYTIFLVSSPFGGFGESFNPQNKFVERLKQSVGTNDVKALFIASNPDNIEFTEGFSEAVYYNLKNTGIEVATYEILDGRNCEETVKLVDESNFIILSGGHVPTQNSFFEKIRLREQMEHFSGVVLGISAGTMNSADVVYAQPEEEGEGNDPCFNKYLRGLNLTKANIIPHYQDIKNKILDGKRLFEDITYLDSMRKKFYALPDGSYLYSYKDKERICGDAYLISDGVCRKICTDGEELELL